MVDIYAPGQHLYGRFVELGDMRGKPVDEIIAKSGMLNSRSSMAGGKMLMQWQVTGFHIALLFGPDGKCIKITHEFIKLAPAPQVSIRGELIGLGIIVSVILGLLAAVMH